MVFHKLKTLATLDDYILLAGFKDGEWRKFDLKPLMEKYPPFRQLKDETLYRKARIDVGGFGIVWNDEVDLSAEGVYIGGEKVDKAEYLSAKADFAKILAEARRNSGLSQNDLARLSGVAQSTITRIEKGEMDPSISTVEKLLSPLGMSISFK